MTTGEVAPLRLPSRAWLFTRIGAVETVAVESTPSTRLMRSGASFGIDNDEFCGPVRTKSAVMELSNISDVLSRIVAPSMPMELTIINPSVKAKDVVAVRRGLRRELVAASLPTTPNGAPTIRPSPPTSGMDSIGPASHRPMTRKKAPTPMMLALRPIPPALMTAGMTTSATPRARTTPPKTVRTSRESLLDWSPLRIA